MKISDALTHWGKRVRATCKDGEEFSGLFEWCQTHADEPDEPEAIGIAEVPGFITEISVDEVASIEEGA